MSEEKSRTAESEPDGQGKAKEQSRWSGPIIRRQLAGRSLRDQQASRGEQGRRDQESPEDQLEQGQQTQSQRRRPDQSAQEQGDDQVQRDPPDPQDARSPQGRKAQLEDRRLDDERRPSQGDSESPAGLEMQAQRDTQADEGGNQPTYPRPMGATPLGTPKAAEDGQTAKGPGSQSGRPGPGAS